MLEVEEAIFITVQTIEWPLRYTAVATSSYGPEHRLHRGDEADRDVAHINAELGGSVGEVGHTRRLSERLGGRASVVDAGAPEGALLDQGDTIAVLRPSDCEGGPGLTGPEHDQVVGVVHVVRSLR